MVVVIIIAVVAVLAIPSMHLADIDRHVYGDAAYVSQIVREAKMRAIGRGGAVLLDMTSDPSTNSAAFTVYESVASNLVTGGTNETPVSSCGAPTVWPGAPGSSTANYVEQYLIMGGTSSTEGQANIAVHIYDPAGALVAATTHQYLCFTPGGRTFYAEGSPATFTALPLSVTVVVQREDAAAGNAVIGISRTVIIPASGATRITSQ
jgi:hypothetical protein